jgi:hypothetical protein
MKNWIFLLALSSVLLVFANCEDNDPPIPPAPALSTCLEQKVQEYKDASACGIDSARVIRYHTQIGYVYYFSYEYCCCDYASPIFDTDCNEVCFLGGFGGVQKCIYNSEELALENPVVIWEK